MAKTFAVAAERVIRDESSRSNGLSDGNDRLSYGELPEIFAAWDEHFSRRGVAPDDCLAVEGSQSLAGMLTILYLFVRERSFLLLPPEGARYRVEDEDFIPRFCRHHVRPAEDAAGSAEIAANSRFTVPPEDAEQGRLYLRTSGSTSSPKIAVHRQRRFLGNLFGVVERLRLSPADRIAIPVPIFHMYGLGAALLPAFLAGADIDLQAGSNVVRYLERERSFEPNVAFLTPAFCTMLVRMRRRPRSYRATMAAGDRLDAGVWRRYEEQSGPLQNLYGSTEMGVIAVADPAAPAAERGVGLGPPVGALDLELVPLGGAAAEAPDVGELVIRSRDGFVGYVDPEGRSTSSGDPSRGGFATGDLARRGDDGRLEVLGRKGHSVNRDGLLLPLADVETGLRRLDAVAEAAVTLGGETLRGREIIAFCAPRDGLSVKAEEIRRACREVLASHAVPDELILVEALPKLPNGKLDRQALDSQAPADTAFAGRPISRESNPSPEPSRPSGGHEPK